MEKKRKETRRGDEGEEIKKEGEEGREKIKSGGEEIKEKTGKECYH